LKSVKQLVDNKLRSATELKSFAAKGSSTVYYTSPLIVQMGNVAQGSTSYQRIGDQIALISLQFRYKL
jgi:hypothetical protein